MENYPKRGQRGEDGRYYTHTDGRVYKASICDCRDCDLASVSKHELCGLDCHNGWTLVEGACVTTDEVEEACDKMREMIRIYQQVGGPCMTERNGEPFFDCAFFEDRTCPARS
ncbi:MAG: hypothetical protein WCR96_02210, partial [Candidatus Methanomethylophilaceae archaeon]